MTYFVIGIITAISLVVIFFKVGWRKALYFELYLDIFFTLGIPLFFAGTLGAMMISASIGVTMTVVLFVLRGFCCAEKPSLRFTPKGRPYIAWEFVPPRFKFVQKRRYAFA